LKSIHTKKHGSCGNGKALVKCGSKEKCNGQETLVVSFTRIHFRRCVGYLISLVVCPMVSKLSSLAILAQEKYLSHGNTKKTRCPHGHLYDTGNTFRKKNGARGCKLCRRLQNMQYYSDHAEYLKQRAKERRANAKR